MPKLTALVSYTKQALNMRTITANRVTSLMHDFNVLNQQQRCEYIVELAQMHGIQENLRLRDLTKDLNNLSAVIELRNSLTPSYRRLFIQMARNPAGIVFLVKFREHVRNQLKNSSHQADMTQPVSLQFLDSELLELLRCWFSAGLFQLHRVTWQSSCNLMERISKLEAVHPVRSWLDVKSRVGPYRRVYAFIHSSMPDEPIVILHTALCKEISHSMSHLISLELRQKSSKMTYETEDQDEVKAAVFYSISAPHRGLQGIDLGQTMIKSVVKELRQEFPNLNTFSTLSPVPGFRAWLQANQQEHQARDLLDKSVDESCDPQTRERLCSLCLTYLLSNKVSAHSLDPVAHFHFSNGAQLWRLNWLADPSPKGMTQSFGLMINYRYFLDQTDQLSERFMSQRRLSISPQLAQSYPSIVDQSSSVIMENFEQ